jgi:translation initiation factor IF-1
MAGREAFVVEGVVREALPNTTYWVELANGHRLRGFVAGKAAKTVSGLAPGKRVKLQLTPFDLSTGRILVGNEDNLK